MSDPFIAEIRIFPFNFAPVNWALCNGQLVPLRQNTALFSLIGTFYGGNGTSTFALPDLEGNVPVAAGQGPGLSQYDLGQFGGGQTVTLLDTENPSHNHALNAHGGSANSPNPSGNIYAIGDYATSGSVPIHLYSPTVPTVTLNTQTIALTGGGQPHNNLMPSLTLNFCIALKGEFPPRS